MANLNTLLERMRQGSVTQGWGAVAVFSRSKLNHLLAQQYIERFQQMAFLPFFTGEVALDERRTDIARLARIEMGAPLLSFSTASMQDSRALLTMNIVSGHYSVRHRNAGLNEEVASTFAITEAMGYQLEMQIDLSMVLGEVDRQGKVTLDLSQGVEFRCNLAGGDQSANQRLAGFFQQAFEQLPADRSVFRLGMLDLSGYSELAPTRFRLLTQAAPGAKVQGANNFGDGGVVVFIRLRGNISDGNFPPAPGFPYLIPDDVEAGVDKYSASLILSEDMRGHVGEGGQLDELGNLLFPGANAFKEVERHTPRDLAIFGNIAPTQTSYRLEPRFKSIKAGQTQQFTLKNWQGDVIQASSWQAISLQSHTDAGNGCIRDGLYDAPSAEAIGHDTLRVVVTATYHQGEEVYTASALVLVAFDDLTVAPRVATRSGGSAARPITLSASNLAGGAVDWALRGPEYGELSKVGAGAVFTPDGRSGKRGLLVQEVEARGAENKVVSLLLINSQQPLRIDPPYVPRLAGAAMVQLQDDPSLLPGLERRWKVIGGGGSVDARGRFTAATEGTGTSSVVSCEIVRNGVVFATGYSVIEVSDLIEEPKWRELSMFTVMVPGGGDRGKTGGLYPNGYQQVRVVVTVQTAPLDGVTSRLSPTELSTMRLRDDSGQEVELVSDDVDGIPASDSDTRWLTRATHNRFDLAQQAGATEQSSPLQDGVTRQEFYLHSRAPVNATQSFHAGFKADYDDYHWLSTKLEDEFSKVNITPREIPTFSDKNYPVRAVRVDGGGDDPSDKPPPEGADDTPFDMHLRTTDYWRFSCMYPVPGANIDFETVEFLPTEGELINTSMISWESEQIEEEMFSWTGYLFQDQKKTVQRQLNFDVAVKDVVRDKESLSIPIYGPGYSKGELVISLHRSERIPYIRKGDKSRDKLSRNLSVRLIDKQGNAHQLLIGFLPSSRVGHRNRLEFSRF